MSRWNVCKRTGESMPLPTTAENMIVAIADMIASQKYSIATYDKDNNIIN
jgi:hypothetical protein